MEVGVIIPCRGPVPWLPQALDSVRAEDPADIVVVDDGSATPFGLPERHRDVRIVRRPVAGGPAAARQTGLEVLGQEWIALCDADDEWLPGRLAAGLEAAGEADVVAGRVEAIDERGTPLGIEPEPLGPLDPAGLFERTPIVNSAVLARRAAIEEAGGFTGLHVHRGEDLDLWLRMAGRGARFVAVERPLARHRRRPGSLTADATELAHDLLLVREAHAGLVDAGLAARVRARDLRALAHGRISEGRWREARLALDEAAALDGAGLRDHALRLAVRVPGLRGRLPGGGPQTG